ncbi:MAG: FKBP-type peptidyl-prolyl cis-trans isomerase [Bacteroidota bacterium]
MTLRIPALALAALLLVSAGCGDSTETATSTSADAGEMDAFETLAFAAGFQASQGMKADSSTFAFFDIRTFEDGFRDGSAGDSSRIAYLYGYELGNRIASDTLAALDSERFLAGFRLGLDSDSSGIPDDELQRVSAIVQDSIGLRQLRSRARIDTSAANQLRTIRENATAAAAFLTEVEGREGTVKTASGLIYEIETEGDGEAPASETDVVRLNYRGTLPDGTVFDERQDGTAMLGLSQVVEGFREGIQAMKVGGKRTIYLPPNLGYGVQGEPRANIPPNSALVFEIELLDVMTLQEASQPVPVQ